MRKYTIYNIFILSIVFDIFYIFLWYNKNNKINYHFMNNLPSWINPALIQANIDAQQRKINQEKKPLNLEDQIN